MDERSAAPHALTVTPVDRLSDICTNELSIRVIAVRYAEDEEVLCYCERTRRRVPRGKPDRAETIDLSELGHRFRDTAPSRRLGPPIPPSTDARKNRHLTFPDAAQERNGIIFAARKCIRFRNLLPQRESGRESLCPCHSLAKNCPNGQCFPALRKCARRDSPFWEWHWERLQCRRQQR